MCIGTLLRTMRGLVEEEEDDDDDEEEKEKEEVGRVAAVAAVSLSSASMRVEGIIRLPAIDAAKLLLLFSFLAALEGLNVLAGRYEPTLFRLFLVAEAAATTEAKDDDDDDDEEEEDDDALFMVAGGGVAVK